MSFPANSESPEKPKVVRAFHPPLIAVHPALSLYAANVALISWRDVLVPLVACALGALLLWGLIWIPVRSWSRAAAGASVLVYLFFSHSAILGLYRSYWLEGQAAASMPVLAWAVPTVLLFLVAIWKTRLSNSFAALLNVAGCAMVLLSAGSIAISHFAISRAIRGRGSPVGGSGSAGSFRPDIYYIVLDGYGRSDTFRRLYGFDNDAFIRGLESRGFYVAGDARSNYCQTELSLASSLNMAPIQELVKPMGQAAEERAVMDDLIDRSTVSQLLKSKGYEYCAILTGFPALAFQSADAKLGKETGFDLFLGALIEKTPLAAPQGRIQSQYETRRQLLNEGFEAIKSLADRTGPPKFVVAHILAPHPPFVFGPEGEPRKPRGAFGYWDGNHFNDWVGSDEVYRMGYRDQLQYISKRVLESLDYLLKRRQKDSIILIQGDHGPKSNLDQNSLANTDLKEAFGILSAFRVPDALKRKLYPNITPVNSFRIILTHLFDEQLPNLPDRSYYSTWGRPLALTDVTAKLEAPR